MISGGTDLLRLLAIGAGANQVREDKRDSTSVGLMMNHRVSRLDVPGQSTCAA